MISRIRVEARADSMEQAQREIEIVLDHACQAGVLEGVMPHSSRVTDDHFGEVRQPDRWTELGQPSGQIGNLLGSAPPRMRYEGRRVLTFDPEITEGGEDLPTNAYGTVSTEERDNSPALFEYSRDIKPGETVEKIVETVFEKVNLWAAGRASQQRPAVR